MWWRFALALVVAMAVQIAVNYANDYFDGVRGVDTVMRAGPRRAVASGLVAPAHMVRAIVVALLVAAAAGVALAATVSWWLLAVGLASFVALLGYSGGPRPYASEGLGELFVFIFFGLVATLGSAYVQHRHLPAAAWVGAIATGMLAVAILVVNNLRDVPTDAVAGKRTLAVRLGADRTRVMYVAMVVAGILLGPLVAVALGAWQALVALLAGGLAVRPVRVVLSGAEGRALLPVLRDTGRTELALGVLLGIGLALAG